MGVIKAAVGDAVLTSMWVFSVPMLGILTVIIATAMEIPAKSLAALFITTILATVLVFTFSLIGNALGGASFNPATTIAFYTAGLKPDASLISMAVRFPAQAAGGAAGATVILQVMPEQYKHMLRGPSLKVDLHTGAIAEGAMNFVLCLAILFIFLRGPKNLLLKVWLLANVTVGLVVAGSGFTGPSLNPANAFGWAYVNNWHNTWELFYVYWICPFIGAILAALVYKVLFSQPLSVKEKAA